MSSKEYFENVADDWDTMRKGFFSNHVRDRAVAEIKELRNKIAVDIGAGTGFLSEGLMAKGLSVIAVDESPAMLKIMKKKLGEGEKIQYLQGESEAVPIDDDFVDYVFANMYLHHVERPPLAIKELYRILKKGGKLVITDLDKHNHEYLLTEHNDRWLGFEHDDIKAWFTQAGFNSVAVDCVGEKCSSTSCGDGEKADINIFIATGTK